MTLVLNVPSNRIVGFYFLAQSLCVVAWWLALWVFPASSRWFLPIEWQRQRLADFGLPDLFLIALVSVFAAEAAFRRRTWAVAAVWSLTGACWYPTLYCISVSLRTGEAWIASGMMSCMAGMTLAMATVYGTPSQSPAAVRVISMNPRSAVIWTLAQTVVFWGICLGVVPQGIIELERHLGIGSFHHSGQSIVAGVMFGFASTLGLWSGIVIATRGDGTPLPTATAPVLVQAGPYRWVRNPMAIAGIAQGIAVGWYFGSAGVIAYALLGAVLWHCCVRPVEERDLANRFGVAYRSYQQQVGLWLPRRPKQS